MKRRRLVVATAGLLAAATFVRAQSAWPSRQPIKLVAQPRGGARVRGRHAPHHAL